VLNRGAIIADGPVNDIRENRQVQEVYLGGGTLFTNESS
jgi:branched-chain amino acid transport system ATP-binding protein